MKTTCQSDRRGRPPANQKTRKTTCQSDRRGRQITSSWQLNDEGWHYANPNKSPCHFLQNSSMLLHFMFRRVKILHILILFLHIAWLHSYTLTPMLKSYKVNYYMGEKSTSLHTPSSGFGPRILLSSANAVSLLSCILLWERLGDFQNSLSPKKYK